MTLASATSREKWRYLYFFEQVALLVRARFLREELASCREFMPQALPNLMPPTLPENLILVI